MFKNASQLTDEDLDFEPSEAKRRKPSPMYVQSASQPAKPSERKHLDNKKEVNFSSTQSYSATSSNISGLHRSTDEFNAFSILQKEAGLDNPAAIKGYYTLAQIQKSVEADSLPHCKVPVTVCSIVSFSVKSAHGDAVITVRDRTGVSNACIQRSLLRTLQPNVLSIRGAALLLTGVTVMKLRRANGGLLSFSGANHCNTYLNVTPKNIVCAYYRPNVPSSAETSCENSSVSASGSSIRRMFYQPGVSSPTSLAAHMQQYLVSFYENALPSVSGVSNDTPTNSAPAEVEEDEIDFQTLLNVASAFDDEN